MPELEYQIAILGAGPGGYVAAIRAAQLGAKVALIERDEPGGTCLNRGCIPTKALLSGAALVRGLQKAEAFGITLGGWRVDYERLVARKNLVVQQLRHGVTYLLNKNQVTLIKGSGRLVGPNRISVAGADGRTQELTAENIIIATGSEPAVPAALTGAGQALATSTEALTWETPLGTLVIVGGGVIGCEFATLFSLLGAKVTIVEMLPRLLPGVDAELAEQYRSILSNAGVTVKTGRTVVTVYREGGGKVRVVLSDGENLAADRLLVAVGRRFNGRGIGLEELGIALGPNGEVPVDEYLRTGVGNVYAIGDVTGKMLLAHVASAQGTAAVQTILGRPTTVNYVAVPSCIYTLPEIAGVGLTEEEAQKRGYRVRVGRFPLLANGRALAADEAEGLVKVVADATDDRVLGVHLLGPHATELIAEATLAVTKGLTASELGACVHAHPTLSEAIKEAAEAVHGLSIHY